MNGKGFATGWLTSSLLQYIVHSCLPKVPAVPSSNSPSREITKAMMGISYKSSPILLGLLIPLVVAQDFRTTSLFPEETFPTAISVSVQKQQAQSTPVQSISSLSASIAAATSSSSSARPSSFSFSSSSSFSSSLSAVASQLVANTLIAAPAETPFPFPFALPEGVARTSSGRPIPCSPKNTKLNPTTHKLISECVETSFCGAPPGSPSNATGLGVCFPRLCRRDEFPFGYGTYGGGQGRKKNATILSIPPMCPKGTFCPDNGSGCRALVEIGGKCELARDEQCVAPPPKPDIGEKDNKVICLNTFCMPATQPLGARCTIENTTYVSDLDKGSAGGGQFKSFVIKHDCLSPSLFCDPTAAGADGLPTCQKTKNLSEHCSFDAECRSNNCESLNTCAPPPDAPYRIAPWQWLATIMFVVVLLISMSLVLAFVHRRQRYQRYQELQAYYYEQMSLRRSILALHAAASADKFNKSEDDSEVITKDRQ